MVSKESHRVTVTAEVAMELKVVIKEKVHVITVEPVTYLKDVLPSERSVKIVEEKDTTQLFADLTNGLTVNRMYKEGEDLNMKLNKMTKAKITGHFP